MCITVNNLEHVYKYVEPLAIDFALAVDELQVKSCPVLKLPVLNATFVVRINKRCG